MDGAGPDARGRLDGGVDVTPRLVGHAGDRGTSGGISHAHIEPKNGKPRFGQRVAYRPFVRRLRLGVELDGVEAMGPCQANTLGKRKLLPQETGIGRETVHVTDPSADLGTPQEMRPPNASSICTLMISSNDCSARKPRRMARSGAKSRGQP